MSNNYINNCLGILWLIYIYIYVHLGELRAHCSKAILMFLAVKAYRFYRSSLELGLHLTSGLFWKPLFVI
jgi:hypothetical protein